MIPGGIRPSNGKRPIELIVSAKRNRFFVYKLVIAGSIEERIIEMQERKGALARALLDDDRASDLQLTEEDLEHLLSPVTGS